MKLKNKKTGEIKEVIVSGYPVSGKTEMWECSEMDSNEETGYKTIGTYTSLAELNREWEDVLEKPKGMKDVYVSGLCKNGVMIEFETKEEAEKTVEKLKAWKRLKDKGFEFIGKTYETDKRFGSIFYKVSEDTYSEDIIDDLDLLFGGEE